MGVIQQIIVDDMIPQTRAVFAFDASDISCSKSPELGSIIPKFPIKLTIPLLLGMNPYICSLLSTFHLSLVLSYPLLSSPLLFVDCANPATTRNFTNLQNMPHVTRPSLQARSGLDNIGFGELWITVRTALLCPENRIGLAGPTLGGGLFEEWVTASLENWAGEMYWGAEARGIAKKKLVWGNGGEDEDRQEWVYPPITL